jgi:beta-glucosidase
MMFRTFLALTLGLAGIFNFSPLTAQKSKSNSQAAAKLPYQDPNVPIEQRVEDLLARMTLEEKIGQMTQIATTEINTVTNPKTKGDKFKPYLDAAKATEMIRKYHVGSFLAAFAVTPKVWYDFSMELQKIALRESRLGIPIIYGNDHVHGANYVTGATIFPQPINIANTFNDVHAAEMGRITTIETADLGQHWNFAPILDVGRNPYWPRQYETFGEAPLVCTRMGVAYIKALQEAKAAAPYKVAGTAKHFIGYSDPKTGWDRVPAVLSDQELREVFLPPFKAAVDAGVRTFMINSGEVNGVPVHASKKLLQDLLRKELGFKGVVVSDWADILQLIGQHRVAHDEYEATKMALEAGIDMSMTASSTTFCTVTKELVESGQLPKSVIDDAVRRILRLKFEIGLFENPFPRADRFARIGAPEHRAKAKDAARESLVLLKNDGVLPLKSDVKSVLLVGPSIHSRRNVSGGWTIEWGGAPESSFPASQETVFTALKKALPNAVVDTVSQSLAQMQTKAQQADVIIIACGEEPYAEGNGNINDLNLPLEQQEMIAKMVATGKPTVLVMLAGRPRLPGKGHEKLNAFLFAGLPSFEGAEAIAEVLTGATNPSGKLSFTYPSDPGHITPHNCKVHDKLTALYPFGHGLSYTSFSYDNLTLSDSILHQNQSIKASVRVSNTGKVEGMEAILWFASDEVRTITPTHKELVHYEKITLKPGESKVVTFEIQPYKHLAFVDDAGRVIMENGYHTITVGNQSKRLYFQPFGKKKTINTENNRKYLQEELLEP